MTEDGERDERPYRAWRRERLKMLLAEAGGPQKLAALCNTVDTHLIAMSKGRRNVGDELATKLEAKMQKPVGWMDQPLEVDGAPALPPEIMEIARRLNNIEDPLLKRIAIAQCASVAFEIEDEHRLRTVEQEEAPEPLPPATPTKTAKHR